jgi:PWWP domain/AWS domain
VCESGRMPLYNEIVWAKYSIHRWWPAIILPPPVVPEIMLKKQRSAFEFCIRFFGSHDFCWIKRERVFLYQEGDSNSLKKTDKPVYNQALIEAKEIFEYLQEQKKNDPQRYDNRPPLYTRIKCNRPIPPVKLNGNEERDNNDDVCDCIPNDEEPCGLSSNCINRTLNQECNPATCPAGLKCCNQYFKNRKYPKMKIKRTPGRGWGLNTLEEIKAGTFVIEYVGELIDNSELEYRLRRKAAQNDENYYFLTINANVIIDAGPKGVNLNVSKCL